MGDDARLRKGLAGTRALPAALVTAVALLPAAPSAAAGADVAWTKTWAERQLTKHFHPETVACLPLGAATVQNGSRAFKQFVCGLVLQDGSRYTIRLKPLTTTTWKTLNMKRLGPEPPKRSEPGQSGGSASGAGSGHAGGNAQSVRAAQTVTNAQTDGSSLSAGDGQRVGGGNGNGKGLIS